MAAFPPHGVVTGLVGSLSLGVRCPSECGGSSTGAAFVASVVLDDAFEGESAFLEAAA